MIPDEAVEAAHRAICEDDLDECLEWRGRCVKAVEAAAPHLLREVWQSAYDQGVDDERTSQANPGIAGCFCSGSPCRCIIAPARDNPYRKPTNV